MLEHLPLPWRLAAGLVSLLFLLLFPILLLLLHRPPPDRLPSPWRLPIIGDLHRLGLLPHRSLRALSRKHGPLMLLHFGSVPTLVVSSAASAEEIMRTQDLTFASRPDLSICHRLLYDANDIAFAKYGDYWRQMRRVITVHLLSHRRINSYRRVREEEASLLVDRIAAAAPSGSVDISDLIVTFTRNITCRVAFGKKYTDEEGGADDASRFRVLLSELMALLGSFPMRDYMPALRFVDCLSGLDERVRKNALDLDVFVEEVLTAHERKQERNDDDMDFVDILLSLDSSEGVVLRRDSIKAIIMDVFGGGIDTTFATLEWAMAELIRQPAKMERAQQEVRRIAGSKSEIREEMLQEMLYLKAVIKETLRLHPALPLLVPREAMQETRVHGYLIPKGTRVLINAWAIGRDPRSWEEKPEEFWPERFLEDASVDFRGQNFQFIPFGAGRRGCPGMDFAFPVLELALANLLYHFDWALPQGMTAEEMDMTEFYGIVVRKKSSLILVPRTTTTK
ncbi:cytochrome P450 71A1-like [Curcuma longa]|uniref:cytochrome P450 71A1-like n=1 Tax=Curcuma longa TaxID=136217 RepID=UPI003D9F8256